MNYRRQSASLLQISKLRKQEDLKLPLVAEYNNYCPVRIRMMLSFAEALG